MNENKKPSQNHAQLAKNDQCTMHMPLPTQKKEEFKAIDNRNIDKTAPA